MTPAAAAFHQAIQLLHGARIKHAVVTNSISADWFLRTDASAGTALDAYILLDRADFSRAKAALEAGGFAHRSGGAIELFLNRPDAPTGTAVRLAFPGVPVELHKDRAGEQKFDAEFLEYLRRRHMPVTVTAKEEINRLIATHIAPGLKSRGFKKHARTFRRDVGPLIHLIAFDGSWTSDRQTASFNIILGVWSRRVAALNPWPGKAPPLPKSGVPSIAMCHWQSSLHIVFPEFRKTQFECQADSENAKIAATTRKAVFERVLPLLDTITDDAAFLRCIAPRHGTSSTAPPRVTAILYRLEGTLKQFDEFARPYVDPKADWDNAEFRADLKRIRSEKLPPEKTPD